MEISHSFPAQAAAAAEPAAQRAQLPRHRVLRGAPGGRRHLPPLLHAQRRHRRQPQPRGPRREQAPRPRRPRARAPLMAGWARPRLAKGGRRSFRLVYICSFYDAPGPRDPAPTRPTVVAGSPRYTRRGRRRRPRRQRRSRAPARRGTSPRATPPACRRRLLRR